MFKVQCVLTLKSVIMLWSAACTVQLQFTISSVQFKVHCVFSARVECLCVFCVVLSDPCQSIISHFPETPSPVSALPQPFCTLLSSFFPIGHFLVCQLIPILERMSVVHSQNLASRRFGNFKATSNTFMLQKSALITVPRAELL